MCMARINKRPGFLIKFIDGSYEIAKNCDIVSHSIRPETVMERGQDGKERPVTKGVKIDHQQEYLDYVDYRDSGTVAPMRSVISFKSIRYKPHGDQILIYSLDGKEILSLPSRNI